MLPTQGAAAHDGPNNVPSDEHRIRPQSEHLQDIITGSNTPIGGDDRL